MESSGSHRCWSLSKHVSSDTFAHKLKRSLDVLDVLAND